MAGSTADPGEFIGGMTREYRERMEIVVDEHYDEAYFDRLGGPETVIREEFPHTAWRELFIGCLPSNRQLHLVYEQGEPYRRDRDLVVGLLKQIRDEVKHARVFSNLAERFGVESDLVTWEPPHYDLLVEQTRAAVEHDRPQYISAGFQCSTEIMAAFMIGNLADYLEPDYADIATTLRDVVADEGDHVHVGRLVAERFATSDDFDAMEEIARRKYEAAVAVLEDL